MSFPANVYLLAILSALATTLTALPFWRKWCVRSGLVDDPGHRKIHDRPIPLAGGLAVFTGLALPIAAATVFLSAAFGNQFGFLDGNTAWLLEYGVSRRAPQLVGIFAGAAGMLLIGWLDDKHELPPLGKFAGQLAVALLVAACGVRITLFVDNLLFSYAVTVLWILTLVNAFNFMDNMNGLCAGLGAISAWIFGVLAAAGGQYLVALIALLTFGALLGFLPFNFPHAKAFLGDAGSHLVGYLMSVLAILPHFHTEEKPKPWAVLIPLLVLAVPLADLMMVVLIRWRLGKPFYVGDTNHLSHRLVRAGLGRPRAVLLIWLAAATTGAIACLI